MKCVITHHHAMRSLCLAYEGLLHHDRCATAVINKSRTSKCSTQKVSAKLAEGQQRLEAGMYIHCTLLCAGVL